MREILFRGKRRDNNKWYYGNYLFLHLPYVDWTGKESSKKEDVHYIEPKDGINIAVFTETVGQFTGMCDKNGVKIFEGDIIHVVTPNTSKDCRVRYECGQFCIGINMPLAYVYYSAEVIGNIYDNLELMEDNA